MFVCSWICRGMWEDGHGNPPPANTTLASHTLKWLEHCTPSSSLNRMKWVCCTRLRKSFVLWIWHRGAHRMFLCWLGGRAWSSSPREHCCSLKNWVHECLYSLNQSFPGWDLQALKRRQIQGKWLVLCFTFSREFQLKKSVTTADVQFCPHVIIWPPTWLLCHDPPLYIHSHFQSVDWPVLWTFRVTQNTQLWWKLVHTLGKTDKTNGKKFHPRFRHPRCRILYNPWLTCLVASHAGSSFLHF